MRKDENLIIIGAGGHGRVVGELARDLNLFKKIDFLDDEKENSVGKLEEYGNIINKYKYGFVAFGDNLLRRKWMEKLNEMLYIIPVLIHPKAYVSKNAFVQYGTVIEANASINSGCVISKGCIVGMGAIIDHDCFIGDYSYIQSGAIVKDGTFLPMYSNIKSGEVADKKQNYQRLRMLQN